MAQSDAHYRHGLFFIACRVAGQQDGECQSALD